MTTGTLPAPGVATRYPAPPDPPTWDLATLSVARGLMGGTVSVHLQASDPALGHRDAERLLGRIGAWADRLTRFTTTSDLARLNDDPRTFVPVRPTLAAIFDWGRLAEGLCDGIVDIALLDERLAAEGPGRGRATPVPAPSRASRSWSLDRRARGAVVRRSPGLRFDLDGIAKGWIADRALDLLARYPAAAVDADGDIAVRLALGIDWAFGVADPRSLGPEAGPHLAVLRLTADPARPSARFGLATSGTTVHRWETDGRVRHHLIDPRTAQPALTDVVQATVLAGSARVAEAWAKSAVIVGSSAALRMLDRPDVLVAVLLTERGDVLLTPPTTRWLA